MNQHTLRRDIGLFRATGLGLGSILGTGVFVSIGIGAGVAGGWVVLATLFAGLLATANALSSAQLAAAHPVSGGTYEYAYRLLSPSIGFSAGWMFLCAKSASAATAALGFAGYALGLFSIQSEGVWIAVAIAGVIALTILVLRGLKRSSIVNTVIVVITVSVLLALVVAVFVRRGADLSINNLVWDTPPGFGLLEGTALMFVAFTGYGRIATLGEEVREPERTIPRAIILTLVISGALYIAVSIAGVLALGAPGLSQEAQASGAPLEVAARAIGLPWLATIIGLGAVTAMLGVLLNLILGLSRVVLAMARRGDAPSIFARVDAHGRAPVGATIGVGLVIAFMAAAGSVRLAWSFSAFTVLVYYAITNLAALRLPEDQRLYPRWIAWCGLAGCLGLAWWVEVRVWIVGLCVLLFGVGARWLIHRFKGRHSS